MIEMQKTRTAPMLAANNWDLAIVGKPIDDRGNAAVAFLNDHTQLTVELRYQADDLQITLNGTATDEGQIERILIAHKKKRIILESTTLGFAEVFLCCRTAYYLDIKEFSFLYVEPENYSRPRKKQILHKRDFQLSGTVSGFSAIPGGAMIIDDRAPPTAVFFLGYEERRLDRALDEFSFRTDKCSVVFGVPAFQPGWEMDAFANNIRVIEGNNIRGTLHFCGAENPRSAYEAITEVHQTVAASDRLVLAPIGTKPHGIGAAVYAAKHPEVGILYDHPERHPGRSTDTFNWHLYVTEF